MTTNLALAAVLLTVGTAILVLTVRMATRGLADLRQLRVKVDTVLTAMSRQEK